MGTTGGHRLGYTKKSNKTSPSMVEIVSVKSRKIRRKHQPQPHSNDQWVGLRENLQENPMIMGKSMVSG
jgi:hypothetical protein